MNNQKKRIKVIQICNKSNKTKNYNIKALLNQNQKKFKQIM